MKIERNYDLTKLNTFGIFARAKFFTEINNESDLAELFLSPEFKNNKRLLLGGGSNVLFTKDFDGIVVLNKLKGIAPTEVGVPTQVGKSDVYIRAMGGEIWHDLVVFAVERGYWGIENLSLIPGTVGAAPMQNIGAYGAELADVLENIEAYEIESDDGGKKKIFTREECELGYRDSIFKNKLKDKYFISAITLKLSKILKPNLSYKILSDYLEKPARTTGVVQSGGNKIEYSLKDISDAVSEIRRSKLPDPKVIPNAGSFFKNVFISEEKISELLKTFPDMPYFKEDKAMKIPAGWLIEQCGPANGTSWKGKRVGNVGVHGKQALVIVNYGGATGEEVKNLADKIIASVFAKFGLELVPEVNLI